MSEDINTAEAFLAGTSDMTWGVWRVCNDPTCTETVPVGVGRFNVEEITCYGSVYETHEDIADLLEVYREHLKWAREVVTKLSTGVAS